MKNLLRIVCVLVVCVAGSRLLMADREYPQVQSEIRFLDLQRCLDDFKAVQAQMENLVAEFENKRTEFAKEESQFAEMEGKMAVMDPQNVEFARLRFQLESGRDSLEQRKKFESALLERRRIELFISAYKEIQIAAAEYGRNQGFGAIVLNPGNLDELPPDLQAAMQALQVRSVLWTNSSYDVTDQVVQVLNR